MMDPKDLIHAIRTDRKISGRKSVIGSVLALVALLALGWLAWYLTHPNLPAGGGPARTAGQGGPGGPPAVTVGVATAERADIPVELEALGTVTAAATATVRPQVSGVMQKVLFTEGQMVNAGQVLAIIDPRQFEIAVMQATGQRQRDEAQLENARVTLQRYRTLLEQDSIARQDLDTQAALVKQLEGTVVIDRAAEATARLNLSYTRIVAPIGGRVGLRVVDIGNVVGPTDANGIAILTQLSPIDVVFAMPQDQVPELRARLNDNAALPVTVLDRDRTKMLGTGSFLALDNQVDTQTGTVRAKARFANANSALFPSQFVNVRLLMRTIRGAVVVPISALRHGSNGDFVFVLNAAEKTVALRPVKRGQATVDKVEITSGLAAGEQVITEGADRLKDGARVILPGDKPGFGAGGAAGAADKLRGNRGASPDGTAKAPPANGAPDGAANGGRRRRPADAAAQ
jgi:multidrug efflux system membrane fusion protein